MTESEKRIRRWLAGAERGETALSPRKQLAEIADLRAVSGDELSPELDARLLIAEADALAERGREDDAFETLGRAVDKFEASDDDRVRQAVAFSLVIRMKMLAWEHRVSDAEHDARRLIPVFEAMTSRTQARAQVGRMLIDAAFWLLALGSTSQLEAIIDVAESFVGSDDTDERSLAAAGALYVVLLRGRAGELDGLEPYVRAFGHFGEECLPVLDQIQRRFGPPDQNPTYTGMLEGLRAVVLLSLGRHPEATAAIERAEKIYVDAHIPGGQALVRQFSREMGTSDLD